MIRKLATLFVVACLQGLLVSAVAQEQPGVIGEVVRVRPKAGMEKQFEAAGKEHIAWHKQKNDTWAWFVWQVVTGPRAGDYIAGTFGHNWADFDTAPVSREEDGADAGERMGPYVDSMQPFYVAFMPKHSRPTETMTPSKYSTVLTIHVKQGMDEAYLNAVSKIPKAIEKTNWPIHYGFYALANGGDHPTFFLVLPRDKWADFAPPEKSFEKMLHEAYGSAEAEAILKTMDKATANVSSEMNVFRPDMSYVPEGM